jgi:hypothetical protein
MTEPNGFIARMKALPVLFPLVGLFHLAMLLIGAVQFAQLGELGSGLALGSLAHWLVYGLVWLLVCLYQKRTAAIAYVALTSIELLLQFFGPEGSLIRELSKTLFPFHILLCFFLLVYYKRFR